MPIPISCPRCGTTREVKDKYAGLKVQCKNCGEFIRVTGFEVIEEADVVEVADEEEVPVIMQSRSPSRRRERPGTPRDGMHLGVVSALFAVGLILIAGFAVLVVYGTGVGNSGFDFVPSMGMNTPPGNQPPAMPPPPRFTAPPPITASRETKEGDITVTISNPRRVQLIGGREGYEVDYVFSNGAPPQPGERYYLMMKTPAGTSEMYVSPVHLKNQGTLSVELFGSAHLNRGGRIELWMEKSLPDKPRQRERVSNKESL